MKKLGTADDTGIPPEVNNGAWHTGGSDGQGMTLIESLDTTGSSEALVW